MNTSGGPNKATPTPESARAALDTIEPGDYGILLEALGHVISENQALVSFVQRKLDIGYGRAARIMDALERGGYVGPSLGPNKSREVLVTEVPQSLKDEVVARSGVDAVKPEDIPSIESMPSVFALSPIIGDRQIVSLTALGDGYVNSEGRVVWNIDNITVDTFKSTQVARAKVRLNDGTTMEGDFLNGNKLGNGIITDPRGNVTTVGLGLRDEGALADEPLAPIPYDPNYIGQGTMRNEEGVYAGTFNKGFVKGRHTRVNGSFVDVDMTEGNSKNGKGRKTWSDGTIEEGEFINDLLLKGREILKDGTILEGVFDIDHNLLGKITYGAGTPTEVVMEGRFDRNRMLNGPGKITRKGKTTSLFLIGNIEEGNFTDNMLLGRGKRTYSPGTDNEFTEDGIFEKSRYFKASDFVEGTITRKNGKKTTRKDGKDYTGDFDESLTGTGEMKDVGTNETSRGTFKNGVLLAPEVIPRDEYARLQNEVTSANNAMDQIHAADMSIEVDLDSKALDILKNLKEGVVIHLGSYGKQIPIENFKRLLLMPVRVALEEGFPTDNAYMDALYEAVLDKKDRWVYEPSVYKKIGVPSSRKGLHPERLFNKFRARIETERINNTPTPHTFTPPPMNAPNSGTDKPSGITDKKGNIWSGVFTRNADDTFSGWGEVTSPAGMRGSGEFKDNAPVNATVTMPDGTIFHYKDGKVVEAPAPAAAPAPSAPRLDAKGNEWTGVDESFSGHGKVVYQDGTIEEGTFKNSILIEGRRICGYVLLKGNIEDGTFRKGVLCKGRITYPDGRYVDVDMYEGDHVDGKGKKTHEDGAVEEGEFKDSSLLKGKKTDSRGSQDGEFYLSELKKGRRTFADGKFVDIEMSEGNEYNGKGRRVWNNGTIEDGEFVGGKLIVGKFTKNPGKSNETVLDGSFQSERLWNGTITEANGTVTKVVDGKLENPSRPPTPHTFTPPVTTPVPATPAPDASTPRLDSNGNEWTGVDDSFSGRGKVEAKDGGSAEGIFSKGGLIEGRRIFADVTFVNIEMSEGNEFTGKGRKVWSDGTIEDGEFDMGKLIVGKLTKNPGTSHELVLDGSFDSEQLWNGTITEADGTITKVVDGVEEGSTPSGSGFKTPNGQNPIKGIGENAEFGEVFKTKKAEAMKGLERIKELVRTLSDEDQRLIGELHIKFIDRTPPAPRGLGKLFTKKTTKIAPWRARNTNEGEGNTFIEIDPLRLPDDREIKEYLITAAKAYDNQRKVEMEVEVLRREVQLSLAYDDDGVLNFLKSLDGIKKIKTAIQGMSEEEKDALSRSDLLILMVGQKKEYYIGSKYRIILPCDTSMGENQIASYLRGELRRVEQEDAAGGAPSRKPTKKSVPGIFSKTRGKIAGVLAALTVAGGGAAAYQMTRPKAAPVDVDKAPAPRVPKAAEKVEEAVKAPEEAPKAPEKGSVEAGEIKKVDLSKIPVGGTVKFKTLEDGVKMGVLVKDGLDYVAVDKFEFVKDGSNAVERLKK